MIRNLDIFIIPFYGTYKKYNTIGTLNSIFFEYFVPALFIYSFSQSSFYYALSAFLIYEIVYIITDINKFSVKTSLAIFWRLILAAYIGIFFITVMIVILAIIHRFRTVKPITFISFYPLKFFLISQNINIELFIVFIHLGFVFYLLST